MKAAVRGQGLNRKVLGQQELDLILLGLEHSGLDLQHDQGVLETGWT